MFTVECVINAIVCFCDSQRASNELFFHSLSTKLKYLHHRIKTTKHLKTLCHRYSYKPMVGLLLLPASLWISIYNIIRHVVLLSLMLIIEAALDMVGNSERPCMASK